MLWNVSSFITETEKCSSVHQFSKYTYLQLLHIVQSCQTATFFIKTFHVEFCPFQILLFQKCILCHRYYGPNSFSLMKMQNLREISQFWPFFAALLVHISSRTGGTERVKTFPVEFCLKRRRHHPGTKTKLNQNWSLFIHIVHKPHIIVGNEKVLKSKHFSEHYRLWNKSSKIVACFCLIIADHIFICDTVLCHNGER